MREAMNLIMLMFRAITLLFLMSISTKVDQICLQPVDIAGPICMSFNCCTVK